MGGGLKKRLKKIHERSCIHLVDGRDPCGKPQRQGGPNGWLCITHDARLNHYKTREEKDGLPRPAHATDPDHPRPESS